MPHSPWTPMRDHLISSPMYAAPPTRSVTTQRSRTPPAWTRGPLARMRGTEAINDLESGAGQGPRSRGR